MTSILFDLDGTLVDSSQGIFNAFRQSFEKLGLTPLTNQEMKAFIGPPLKVTFQKFFDKEDEVQQAIACFRSYYNIKGVHEVTTYPKIKETLQKLIDKGCQLYVTTSKHQPMADLMLEEQGLTSYFKAIYGSTENRYHKADVIKACLIDYDITPETAYIIGDTSFDMIGGKTAGINTVGVSWGFGTEDELTNSGADAIVHIPLELLQLFN